MPLQPEFKYWGPELMKLKGACYANQMLCTLQKIQFVLQCRVEDQLPPSQQSGKPFVSTLYGQDAGGPAAIYTAYLPSRGWCIATGTTGLGLGVTWVRHQHQSFNLTHWRIQESFHSIDVTLMIPYQMDSRSDCMHGLPGLVCLAAQRLYLQRLIQLGREGWAARALYIAPWCSEIAISYCAQLYFLLDTRYNNIMYKLYMEKAIGWQLQLIVQSSGHCLCHIAQI